MPRRRSWSPGRWTWGVAAVLAVQVLLVLSLSDRSPLRRREPVGRLRLTLLPPPAAGSALAELQALADPTLFALPSDRGLAGAGWRRGADFAYEPDDWTEPLHWLTNRAALPRLSQLGEPGATNRPARLDKPDPRVSKAAPTPLPVPVRSALRITGAAAPRALRSVPELPSIVHSNLLADTAVRVGIQADGYVFSAAIARSSGLPAADNRALEIARAVRFEPEQSSAGASRSAGLSWGELIFRWHVRPGTERPGS